jgi:putative ABC transport system permease protein
LFNAEYEAGRYYTPTEYHYGVNKILIGHNVAEALFGSANPIGKNVKLSGRDMEVIGVFKKSGKDILRIMNFDDGIILSYELARKFANVKPNNPWGGSVNVKAVPGASIEKLKDELTGTLRATRKLKPKEEDNFALNNLTILANLFDQFFGVLNMVGYFIGIFAILVGMFSVANIMFVSVKERTNIIGIKKALGAKQVIILLEFLIESVILCIIGGALGLGLVYLVLTGLTSVLPFEIYLDWSNALFGLGLSVLVGIISGLIPALQAARMDPVDAIRHGG